MSRSKNGPVQTGKLVDGEIVMETPVVVTSEEVVDVPSIESDDVVEPGDGPLTVLTDRSFLEGTTEHKFESKSKMFLALYDRGWKVGQIAKITQSHYSFVYGVIDGKRGIQRQETLSKSDVIRQMVDLGYTPGQIAKELNSNYSYVHSVVKKYKAELGRAV